MKKLAAGALLALLLVALCLPAGAVMNKYSTMYLDSFDTVITLIGYAESEETFNEQADQVHEMFLYMHKLFDTYNSYEDEGIVSIFTLNERAAQEPVAVDPILFSLLTFCKANYALCHEQVNVAMAACSPSGTNTVRPVWLIRSMRSCRRWRRWRPRAGT